MPIDHAALSAGAPTRSIATHLLGAGGLFVIAAVSILKGVPVPWSPLPLIPFALTTLGVPSEFVYMAAPAAFWAWCPGLLKGSPILPKRSVVALTLGSILTPTWLLWTWRDGLEVQGWPHVATVTAANLSVLVVLWLLAIKAFRRPSFHTSFAFHWLATGWLFSIAFPYLGPHP